MFQRKKKQSCKILVLYDSNFSGTRSQGLNFLFTAKKVSDPQKTYLSLHLVYSLEFIIQHPLLQ